MIIETHGHKIWIKAFNQELAKNLTGHVERCQVQNALKFAGCLSFKAEATIADRGGIFKVGLLSKVYE